MDMAVEAFVDPEAGIRALLLAEFPDLEVGETPGTGLAEKLPYVAVDLQGGAQDYFQDDPVLDIDCFAPTKAAAKLLAAEVSAFLCCYPHTVMVGTRRFTIDSVGVVRRPVPEPWDDESIRRVSATYQLSARR